MPYRKLDDIIFRNREKQYGAFDLRKKYFRTLFFSVLLINGISLLFFLLFSLYEQFSQLNEFKNIDYVDIEYYSLDTLIKIEQELPLQINEEVENQHTTFKVSDSTKIDSLFSEKEDEPQQKQITGNDSSQSLLTKHKSDTFITRSFHKAEVMPQFPDGKAALYRYIATKIKNPGDEILKNNIGMVVVAFCIDEEGNVCNTEIKKGIHPQVDSAVVHVIRSMPKWIPGTTENRNVKVIIHIPIIFSGK